MCVAMSELVFFLHELHAEICKLQQDSFVPTQVTGPGGRNGLRGNSLNLHCISPQISAECEFSAHSCVVCDKQIMADDFLEGKMLETDFLRNFMEKRKVSHVMYCIYIII